QKAPEASVQQGFHLVSFGQDENLVISYTFDINSKYMKNATVSLVGTNLFFFYKKAPFDPEQVSGNTPGGVGVDSFGLPVTRSIGLSLKANF
ncbi:hypothetical protein, partial [Chryseobacterium lactis]|uniref:hypothetical protein n=1 Tax=Chryseobacterium lactis TaxID=1241981 RepID=UPI0021AB6094